MGSISTTPHRKIVKASALYLMMYVCMDSHQRQLRPRRFTVIIMEHVNLMIGFPYLRNSHHILLAYIQVVPCLETNSAIVKPTTSATALTSATSRCTSWLVRPSGSAPRPKTISNLWRHPTSKWLTQSSSGWLERWRSWGRNDLNPQEAALGNRRSRNATRKEPFVRTARAWYPE